MNLRKYQSEDCKAITELFYETVHTVNAEDYSEEQLAVWAKKTVDFGLWNRSLLAHDSVVALEDGQIVGFGDMDESGYLDRLYVHKDYQRCNIATAICDELEKIVKQRSLLHMPLLRLDLFLNKEVIV